MVLAATAGSPVDRIRRSWKVCLLTACLLAFCGPGRRPARAASVDGLTIRVKQPAPMSTSLYVAPQTYDRVKQRYQRRNPYILVPKLKHVCDWTAQQLLKGVGRQPHNGNRLKLGPGAAADGGGGDVVVVGDNRRPGAVVQLPLDDNQLILPTAPSLAGQENRVKPSDDFPGSWKLQKPDATKSEHSPTNQFVTYNEDGTRVLPESLYNNNKYNNNNNNKGVKGNRPNDSSTKKPSEYFHNITAVALAAGAAAADPSMDTIDFKPTIPVTGSPSSHRPTGTTSIATALDDDAESEVDATTAVKRLRDEFYSVTLATRATTTTTTTLEVSTRRWSSSPSTIIDKLGGGAKRILAQIIGGILHGRHSQKNFQGNDTFAASSSLAASASASALASAFATASEIYAKSGQVSSGSVATNPVSYSGLLPIPFSDDGQLMPIDAPTDDNPVRAFVANDHNVTNENLDSNGPAAAADDEEGSHASAAIAGWRPVVPWPPAWLKGEPDGSQLQRPAAAPSANLLHFWSSLSSANWNDTTNEDVDENVNGPASSAEAETTDRGRRPDTRTTTSPPPACSTNNSAVTETSLRIDEGEILQASIDDDDDISTLGDDANKNGGGKSDAGNSNDDDVDVNLENASNYTERSNVLVGEGQHLDASSNGTDGSPRMSNASWDEFRPDGGGSGGDGTGRRPVVDGTLRILIRAFGGLPLGIPMPLDVMLLSYGLHRWNRSRTTDYHDRILDSGFHLFKHEVLRT